MRLPEIFMPTEFLHGLYDYWEMMRKHLRCSGGFLWVLADEGVKRVDMNGFIDNCGNYGADGANTCRFTYKYVQLPSVTDKGE